MHMNKAYLLTICLLLTSFIGCIEDSNNLEKTSLTNEENDNEEDPIEPVGEEDISSLEKRVSDLEATIAEYEKPTVFFFNMDESGYSYVGYSGYESYRSDDGYLNCYYYEYYDRNICNLNALYHDVNGMIESYSWKGSEVEIEYGGLCQEDTDPLICMVSAGSGGIHLDLCSLAAVNQTLTLTVYDNDGNEASASYELDYFTNCGRTYETDQIPEISFSVEKDNSSGIYYIDVVSVSEQYDLIDYMYILNTGGGVFDGEIAMTNVCAENCNVSNRPTGIDESYDGNDSWLLWRLDNMTNDDGSEFPVRFYDSDRDGKLSAGDQFTVYGSGNEANGPALSGSSLNIWFVLSDVLAGSVTLP